MSCFFRPHRPAASAWCGPRAPELRRERRNRICVIPEDAMAKVADDVAYPDEPSEVVVRQFIVERLLKADRQPQTGEPAKRQVLHEPGRGRNESRVDSGRPLDGDGDLEEDGAVESGLHGNLPFTSSLPALRAHHATVSKSLLAPNEPGDVSVAEQSSNSPGRSFWRAPGGRQSGVSRGWGSPTGTAWRSLMGQSRSNTVLIAAAVSLATSRGLASRCRRSITMGPRVLAKASGALVGTAWPRAFAAARGAFGLWGRSGPPQARPRRPSG